MKRTREQDAARAAAALKPDKSRATAGNTMRAPQLPNAELSVDLNVASIEELMDQLHGIGITRATAIVTARPFKTPDELVSRGILTEERYKRIADLLTAGPSSTKARRPAS